MGQAKRRGTLAERIANAKGNDYRRDQNYGFSQEADDHIVRMIRSGVIRAIQDDVGYISADHYERLIKLDFQRDDIAFEKAGVLQ